MITAADARKIAHKNQPAEDAFVLDHIDKAIKKASESGRYETYYVGPFSENVKDILKKEEYDLTLLGTDMNGTKSVRISW